MALILSGWVWVVDCRPFAGLHPLLLLIPSIIVMLDRVVRHLKAHVCSLLVPSGCPDGDSGQEYLLPADAGTPAVSLSGTE